MRRRTPVRLGWAWLAVGMIYLAGCEDLLDLKTDRTRFFAPHKVVKAPEHPSVYPILPSLSPADPTVEILPNAERPGPEDWTYTDEDYRVGPTDIVDVSILDLFSDGLETVLRREVSASGYIDLPQLTRRVRADGYTKEQLKDQIRRAYIADEVLQDPTVSVTIAARRQNTFSILGAVGRPGTYTISRKDMRLLDALALAGDVTQTHIRYLYLIRPTPAIRKSPDELPALPGRPLLRPEEKEPDVPEDLPDLPKLEDPKPPAGKDKDKDKDQPPKAAPPTGSPPLNGADPKPAGPPTPGKAKKLDPATEDALRELREFMSAPRNRGEKRRASGAAASSSGAASEASGPGEAAPRAMHPAARPPRPSRGPKFVHAEGRWAHVDAGAPPATAPARRPAATTRPAAPTRERPRSLARPAPGAREPADPYGWRKLDRSTLGRVIAINLTKLKNGDPRMNVVIRSNDIIHVPPLEVGEFYVMGEVARPGVYSLTGRQITVKMALAAAGNLGPLAWPENSVLIRRLGPNQEQSIPLNVEAICRGDEPDVFLKPDDVLAIGTDVRAPFAAVFRNAFRMTYGFGFIYDRNFADPIIGAVDSKRFLRW